MISQILKVSFFEEKLQFEFLGYWWLLLLLSVVSGQHAGFSSDYLFLVFR